MKGRWCAKISFEITPVPGLPLLSQWIPSHQVHSSFPGTLTGSLLSPSQALEAVNKRLRELYPDSEDVFDIVLMTNNHAQVGVRLINSINHYGKHGGWGGVTMGCPYHTRLLGEGHTSVGSGFTDCLPELSEVLLAWHRIVFLTWSFKTCKTEAVIQLVGYLLSRQKVRGSISNTA